MANNDTAASDSALNLAKCQYGLLTFMFEKSPRVSLYPAPPRVIEELSEAVGLDAEQEYSNKYHPVIQLFHELVKLGFVELTILVESQRNRVRRLPVSNFDDGDLGACYRETENSYMFSKFLKTICEPSAPQKPMLHAKSGAVGFEDLEDLFVVQIFYSLTPKGYEIAMSLVAHRDSEAVRLASISSAKTAGRALWAAGAIAVGSVGNLILNLSDHPLRLYCLLSTVAGGG